MVGSQPKAPTTPDRGGLLGRFALSDSLIWHDAGGSSQAPIGTCRSCGYRTAALDPGGSSSGLRLVKGRVMVTPEPHANGAVEPIEVAGWPASIPKRLATTD